jgi:hypothetical protein
MACCVAAKSGPETRETNGAPDKAVAQAFQFLEIQVKFRVYFAGQVSTCPALVF